MLYRHLFARRILRMAKGSLTDGMVVLFILVLVASGVKLQALKKWKQESRGYMRLFIGLLLIGLGWLLILIANGTVNFG